MYYAVIILSEYNLSWVHPGAFVQLTDDINTCFLIPTFRDTYKKTLEEHISQSLSNKTMDGLLTGCQISVTFGMTLILLKMLHSFSCLTKLTFQLIYYYQLS